MPWGPINRFQRLDDPINRYATGHLRPIYFEPADLNDYTERTYAPGD